MIHFILNAAGHTLDCSEAVRALAEHLVHDGQHPLNIRFCRRPLRTPRADSSSLSQLDSAAGICPSYLVGDFEFDPMHFLRERMFYSAHFKQELQPICVQSSIHLRSPVGLFAGRICGRLGIPVPAIETPTFADDFFDETTLRRIMDDQKQQFSAFCAGIPADQWRTLPPIYREIDMDFLLEDWVGLIYYVVKRHVRILPVSVEMEVEKDHDLIFDCTTCPGTLDDMVAVPKRLLADWNRLQETATVWYCETDETLATAGGHKKNIGTLLFQGDGWKCMPPC